VTSYVVDFPRLAELIAERVRAFAGVLEAAGLRATYRRSHGRDIDAACGQLAVAGVRELRRARRAQRTARVAGR